MTIKRKFVVTDINGKCRSCNNEAQVLVKYNSYFWCVTCAVQEMYDDLFGHVGSTIITVEVVEK